MYVSRAVYKKVQEIFGKGQKLSLMVQARPKNGSTGSGPEEPSTSTLGTDSTSQKGKEGTSAAGVGTEEKPSVEVRVRGSQRVGEGQVWIGANLREELGLGIGNEGDFELLKYVFVAPLPCREHVGTLIDFVSTQIGSSGDSFEQEGWSQDGDG